MEKETITHEGSYDGAGFVASGIWPETDIPEIRASLVVVVKTLGTPDPILEVADR